ncbi:MAG: DNA polymerase III subunit [Bacillota bacterium]|nr:DNA polymerase III subunit [Bacillota bacterium]
MEPELKRDIEANNISHAYLIYGEDETLFNEALDFALRLNCLDPQGEVPCRSCRSCLLGVGECFGDLQILRPEKTTYTVKQIRELIKNAQFSAQEGKYRVFLLTDIDRFNDVCANTLLKTLEEPVANTVFLLLSSNPDKTLATIESRCRLIRLGSKERGAAKEALDEAYRLLNTLPRNGIEYIFQLSQSYSGEKDKAKAREDLKELAQAIAEILSGNYGRRHSYGGANEYILPEEGFGDDVLLFLWEEANKALEYLEYQVTAPLIAENLFLAMQDPIGFIRT